MLDDATRDLLESGSSTIIGILDADGAPFATRGWGSVVLDGEPLRIRVVVSAGSLAAAGRELGSTDRFPMAVTGTDVRNLRSVQVKGTAVAVEPVTDDDLARALAFCEDFFSAVEEVDNVERRFVQRLVPTDLCACSVEIEEVYDQTPGPGAGGRIEA